MFKQQRNKTSFNSKSERTYYKRNGVERFCFEPTVSDYDDDYSEDEALIDFVFDQTDEEMEIVAEYYDDPWSGEIF